MMQLRTVLPILLACGLLVACSKATTYAPSASPSEIAEEQRLQSRAAADNPFPPIVEPVKRTEKMKKRLQYVANRIGPESVRLCNEIFADQRNKRCNFRLEITTQRGINAYANGEKVVITPAMMMFAEDDTHLAFVIAHELAHNIMDHPQRAQQNVLGGAILGTAVDILASSAGASTGGAFGKMGAQGVMMRYSPDFEKEADYIGLYILARAGYDISRAPNFWRAMSQHDPDGIYVRTTHPTNPERYVVMRKTINEINSKRQIGMPLMPEFLPVEGTQQKPRNVAKKSS